MSTRTNGRISNRAAHLAAEKRIVFKIARELMAEYAANYAAYLADCEDDRAAGYRAHYCEHGTNRWTDYDNICGPCEDGFSMGDPFTRRQYALNEARSRMAEYGKILAAINLLNGLGATVDMEPIRERMHFLFNTGE